MFQCLLCVIRVHSFGVIWIRIRDATSVWIIYIRRSWWIHVQSGFIGSFDAPWSRQILDHSSWSRSPQGNTPVVNQFLTGNHLCEEHNWLPTNLHCTILEKCWGKCWKKTPRYYIVKERDRKTQYPSWLLHT